jgi:hypothetical protein
MKIVNESTTTIRFSALFPGDAFKLYVDSVFVYIKTDDTNLGIQACCLNDGEFRRMTPDDQVVAFPNATIVLE